MYTTESYTTSIAVSDYKKRYIDIPTFTEYCKACPNYDRLWSCPSYTFDVEAFWNQFQTLDLFAVKILYNDVFQPAPVACAMTIVHAPTACHAVILTNSVIPLNLLAAMSV